jgi:hypothetical protein
MLTNYARVKFLEILIDTYSGYDVTIGLYTNNGVVWSVTTVLTDLVEGAWTGYGRQAPAWGVPSIDGSGHGDVSAPWVTFVNTSGVDVTVYGYFYVNNTLGGDVFSGANFNSPLVIPATVGSLQIQPQFLDDTF